MNKKIIAIAIASAMAAPVAMADVAVTGALGGSLTVNGGGGADSRTFNDSGMSNVTFMVSEANSFAKVGLNVGPGAKGVDALGNDTFNSPVYRDFFIGTKLGNGKISFGKMSGVSKNLEKDPYIATFLQSRSGFADTAAGGNQFGSSSYISNVVQYAMKANGLAIKVQYDPTDATPTSANSGHVGVSVAGKAGAVGYFFGYNNGNGSDTAGNSQSNIKVGAAMKMGTIKGTLMVTSSDDNGAADQGLLFTADMSMGNGLSVNLGLGQQSGDTVAGEGTWTRLGIAKKLSKKATFFGGYTGSKPKGGTETTKMGVGMVVKF